MFFHSVPSASVVGRRYSGLCMSRRQTSAPIAARGAEISETSRMGRAWKVRRISDRSRGRPSDRFDMEGDRPLRGSARGAVRAEPGCESELAGQHALPDRPPGRSRFELRAIAAQVDLLVVARDLLLLQERVLLRLLHEFRATTSRSTCAAI